MKCGTRFWPLHTSLGDNGVGNRTWREKSSEQEQQIARDSFFFSNMSTPQIIKKMFLTIFDVVSSLIYFSFTHGFQVRFSGTGVIGSCSFLVARHIWIRESRVAPTAGWSSQVRELGQREVEMVDRWQSRKVTPRKQWMNDADDYYYFIISIIIIIVVFETYFVIITVVVNNDIVTFIQKKKTQRWC